MPFNKKIIVTLGMLSVVVCGAMTSMTPKKQQDEGFKNLKILPKNISNDNLHKVMEEWEHSLGVHCNFCHVRNEQTKKMDWANDTKPEKEMARDMYKMMNKVNQKYFQAKKDSLGMIMQTGVNCNTCHHGVAHPEVVVPEGRGPGAMPPGVQPAPGNQSSPGVQPAPGNQPAPAGQPVPAGTAPDKKG